METKTTTAPKRRAKSLGELEEKYFGKKGTAKRQDYEQEVSIEIIGELLKQMREKSHLTQSQLAKKLHMDKTYISKMENNVKTQRLDTFLSVLSALHGALYPNWWKPSRTCMSLISCLEAVNA